MDMRIGVEWITWLKSEKDGGDHSIKKKYRK